MTQKKLIGLGELLLRLDTPGHSRLNQVENFGAKFTGGEANVLVAARRFGVEHCSIVSRLPSHALGDACIEFLRRHGIDTRFVARGGERIGILYVESGTSVRPTRVIYDRSNTSFRNCISGDYDWRSILHGADIIHITGTAPALGSNVNAVIDEAISVAAEMKCLVSFDCSFRSALWSIEDAGDAFRKIARRADILFATPGDAKLFFGIDSEKATDRIKALIEDYGLKQVAYTEREDLSASVNRLQGFCHTKTDSFASRAFEFSIVDRIGSGDAFAGVLLASLINGKMGQEPVDLATATAVLKHTVPGDFCLISPEEARELLENQSLRIRR